MVIRKRTFEDLQAQAAEFLLNNTDITMLSPGGTARALIDITTQHLSEFYDTLDTDVSMAFLSTSNGFFLDLIGQIFNVSRGTSDSVSVFRQDKNIKFYASSSGTALSKLLPAQKIPAGTTISNTNGTITYTVTRDENFSSVATFVFVNAQSDQSGVSANIGAGLLSSHDLVSSGISVTNVAPISQGAGTEDDDSFRARISAAATAFETSNETAVRLAVLSTPGVADVEFHPFARGSGTFDLFVIPEGNRVPTATKNLIESRVANAAAYGVSFQVREPDYVPIRVEVAIRFRRTALDGQKQFILSQAEQSILQYIGGIRPSEELIVNRIQSIVIDSDPEVLDAEVVYLCVGGRAQIIRNYRLEDDEVFIPDEDVSNPILVRP